ncbi:telomere capping, CST complex subunit-domain-containing protein [Aspergillus pseudonomiae]|uniref:Telomere capping, CST complex subunit-domain-containing protein n=1 Tax=Aspergillus pseudonomiae TaxID=1506151 RepID=A0A5N7D641_9EURO|nr:telomere capping, CST complex subunit-domain-containing protein [Aspergillus pseudonomiae]KAE8401373.1 telomere capping, CST complex subunit-domain-containing protein [Aspergillus pseudonomiae]
MHDIKANHATNDSVKTYNVATGHLILEHNYPRCKPTQEPPCIPVDVNAVLQTVTADELRVGAWVNVLGYVRREESSVYVEAVMVFRAGAIAVGEYERILHHSLEVYRRVRRPG